MGCVMYVGLAHVLQWLSFFTRAFEQLMGAKSFEQVWEIQSQYAKKAFDAYVAQASKIGERYGDLARSAYQPVEQAAARTARKA